jgi:hypothetical protein
MSAGDAFFDTSVLLYLLSGDVRKADQVNSGPSAPSTLGTGGSTSLSPPVQP